MSGFFEAHFLFVHLKKALKMDWKDLMLPLDDASLEKHTGSVGGGPRLVHSSSVEGDGERRNHPGSEQTPYTTRRDRGQEQWGTGESTSSGTVLTCSFWGRNSRPSSSSDTWHTYSERTGYLAVGGPECYSGNTGSTGTWPLPRLPSGPPYRTRPQPVKTLLQGRPSDYDTITRWTGSPSRSSTSVTYTTFLEPETSVSLRASTGSQRHPGTRSEV